LKEEKNSGLGVIAMNQLLILSKGRLRDKTLLESISRALHPWLYLIYLSTTTRRVIIPTFQIQKLRLGKPASIICSGSQRSRLCDAKALSPVLILTSIKC
jgi:hypothetical protein